MIDVGLGHYLGLGAVIFTIGVVGIFQKKCDSSFNVY